MLSLILQSLITLSGSEATGAAPATPALATECPSLDCAVRRAPGDVISALIRLRDPSWAVPVLEAAGVRFRRAPDGRPRHVGTIYPVDAPARALATLAAMGWEVQVGAPDVGAPTQVTGSEAGTWAVEARGPTPLDGPTGRGIKVMSLDEAIDPFHPHFFQADGGAFAWIDVDDDGRLTPGVDGVDLNADGEVEAHEVLALLDHANEFAGSPADGVFDASVDYLYLDLDGNGLRDSGVGFDESTPGYGEPMYLPDDADGDGSIDVHERVLLLSTSKIAAFRHGDTVWRRGVDLIEMPTFPLITAWHGTSTVGILAGGQDRLFRSHRGLAGDVDIVMGSRLTWSGWADYVETYAWGLEEEAVDVVLHEYNTYSGHELDGSTLVEAAIDESSDAGAVHVCTAGNLAASERHTQTSAMPAAFEFLVPDGSLTFFRITLHWRDPGAELQCVLRNPQDQEHTLVPNTVQAFGTNEVAVDRYDSLGGTSILFMRVVSTIGQHPGAGAWTLECTHGSPEPVTVHAYLRDPMTFWDTFTRFLAPAPDPATTICVPATADSCISLAGYEFQVPWSVPAGELGPWSSRGPRIDGGRTIDIAAPRDAYGPDPSPDQPDSLVHYIMPGGTSGAAPVVVAAVAQLLEAEPGLTSAELRDRLRASAGVDEFVDVVDFPDDGWGHGKLRAYQALYDADPPPRPDFVTRGLDVELQEGDGTCTAVVRVHDVDWPAPTFRWDDDYDGAWDTEFAAPHERPIVLTPDDPTYAVRVEFGREGWRVGGAAVTGEAPASCFMGGGSESSSSSGGGSETGDVVTGGDDPTGGESTGSTGTGGPTTSTGTGSGASASASDTAGGDGAVDGGGCGCTTTPTSAAWWSVALLALRRRRRSA